MGPGPNKYLWVLMGSYRFLWVLIGFYGSL